MENGFCLIKKNIILNCTHDSRILGPLKLLLADVVALVGLEIVPPPSEPSFIIGQPGSHWSAPASPPLLFDEREGTLGE